MNQDVSNHPTPGEYAAFKRAERERIADLHPGVDKLLAAEYERGKAEGAREAVERIRNAAIGTGTLNSAAFGWLNGILDEAANVRESSLGRDAEGHLVLTLGPGVESPSRKEGWDELDGLSPLEQYNREGR